MKKYSYNASVCLKNAEAIAMLNGNVLDSSVLLIALTKNDQSVSKQILNKFGFTTEIAQNFLLKKNPTGTKIILTGESVKKILAYADRITSGDTIKTESILLAVTYHKTCFAAKILQQYGITFELLSDIYEKLQKNETQATKQTNINEQKTLEPTQNELQSKRLYPFGIDLCDEVKITDLIPREKETERLIRVLVRKKKNCPLLIGENGVGKSTLPLLLAKKINMGDIPAPLIGKRVFSVYASSLIAGTKYRGDIEEKIDELISEAKTNNWILFFDDIHQLSTSAGENSSNIQSIMKPYIERGDVLIVGATTYHAYAKFIEKDVSFEGIFEKIDIKEPTTSETEKIMECVKRDFEKHYSLTITEEAMKGAIYLSKKYIQAQFLPEKAIRVLDEACSKTATQKKKKNVEIIDVKETLTEITGIPIADDEDERRKILNIKDALLEKIIGQEEAIESISNAIIRSKSGLNDGKRPIGSFLFIGQTGVGKTETAKALANILFGSEKSLIRFDMSEYSDKNSTSKLIGAPPGYVGYEEGGTLTEKVKRQPYSVLLFDEIEKGHVDVFDLLLQVLDDGRLTDSKGVTVDFKNTIIILTSNIGNDVTPNKQPVGFGENEVKNEDEKQKRIEALKKTMKPEFINRIDEIVVFEKLNKENLSIIADNIIKEKKQNLLSEKGIKLNVSDKIIEHLVEESYQEEYGARPLRRSIDKLLVSKLGEKILKENLEKSEITLSFEKGKTIISVKQ